MCNRLIGVTDVAKEVAEPRGFERGHPSRTYQVVGMPRFEPLKSPAAPDRWIENFLRAREVSVAGCDTCIKVVKVLDLVRLN